MKANINNKNFIKNNSLTSKNASKALKNELIQKAIKNGEIKIKDVSNISNYGRSEEHTSELQSHSFISYAVFCLKKKKKKTKIIDFFHNNKNNII